jgi:hypothetical protein
MKEIAVFLFAGMGLYVAATELGSSGVVNLAGGGMKNQTWVGVAKPEEGEPGKQLFRHGGIEEARGPIADSAEGPVFISEILAEPTRSEIEGKPVLGLPVERVENCQPSRPVSGSKTYHIYAGKSDVKVKYYLISKWSIHNGAKRFLHEWMTQGEAYYPYASRRDSRPEIVNVVVTDTTNPVHLVLHNAEHSMVWNVHKNEGVQISGVTMLDGSANAIANLDPQIPVEVFDGYAMKDCDIVPKFQAIEGPPANIEVLVDASSKLRVRSEEELSPGQQRQITIETYDNWLRSHFNQGAAQARIGFYKAPVQVALAGPKPATPVQFSSLAGAQLRVSPDNVVLGMTDRSYKKDYEEFVNAKLRVLAGGDIAHLKGIKMVQE